MSRLFYAGADVRVDPSGESDWPPERRSKYLLRPDIAFPLSVDPNVWARVPADLPGPVPWTSIMDVQRVAASNRSERPVCVAVLGAAAEDEEEAEVLRRRCGADTALTVDPAWTFVGFDVADDVIGISGLSNCGYGEDLEDRRAVWASRVNDRGLFDRMEEAFAFRELTEAHVPEHAPFSIFGIWIVPPRRSLG